LPYKVVIPVQVPQDSKVNSSWGSIFHGMLMEMLDSCLAGKLHENGAKPWTQYIRPGKAGEALWTISTLTEEMEGMIKKNLIEKLPLTNSLRQKGFDITLNEPLSEKSESFRELADNAFLKAGIKRKHVLEFLTPTTFKTKGNYALYPTADLIVQSLLSKWEAFSCELSLKEDNIRENLSNHIYIDSYKLKTMNFYLESVRIKGFVGTMKFAISGPDALCRLIDLLFSYSRYSGIGIKTALGMGATDIVE
jgi:CRISPR-associated endoribonuclease Cas6